jgi:hypothetical protein
MEAKLQKMRFEQRARERTGVSKLTCIFFFLQFDVVVFLCSAGAIDAFSSALFLCTLSALSPPIVCAKANTSLRPSTVA